MSTKNFFEQWVIKPELTRSIPGVPNLTFDVQAVLESQRKTIQALTEAQQLAVESLQTVAQRQAEIMSQLFQDQSEIAREIAAEGSPEAKIAKGADLARRSYEKTVNGFREVGDIVNKSGREASDIINKRVSCALEEICETIEDQPKAQKKEAPAKSGSKKAA